MPSYYDRYYSSTESNTECNSGSLEYYHANKEKYFTPRRPVLRSTVSEIRPASSSSSSIVGNKKMRPSFKYKTSSGYYGNHPSDEEFAPLIRSRQPRRRKGISNHQGKRTCFTFLCIMFGGLLGICVGWLLLAISSSPLADVEVVGISNVLGTQKELMFNLQVRAK
ncbi:uncharacterized protein B0P05DRAFT_27276 [Gilbertella persicaria]|uniref:uncharacterized protein n=1 Tax=Gilbertella persicaria TaxID=101096 RepID=UPI00221F27FB|nr:uncharacterized protein B0P05DRAFT_27276 [Gilbertella persicaria]KAI8085924.1 hypothetical protein B0P05DRAFT_27276 [Gilbertella persicaria]